MTENTNIHAEFDVEAWLTDAKMPEESAEVYKRADVIAELQVVKRQIETQREASTIEKTAHGDTVLRNLERRYKELVETFTGSKLTIYVKALSPDELDKVRASHEERTKGWETKKANEDYGFDLLSAAICAVKPAEGERVPVSWSVDQVKKIEATIGGTQMVLVLNARQRAQNAAPVVDADFLHKLSGSEAGQE